MMAGLSGGCQGRGGTHPGGWGCGMLLALRVFREGCFQLWQVAAGKPSCGGLLAPGSGDQGDRVAHGAQVARAVGEAVVVGAQRGGAALLTEAVEVFALAEGGRVGMVTIAETLTGESARDAGFSIMGCGAETWHRRR